MATDTKPVEVDVQLPGGKIKPLPVKGIWDVRDALSSERAIDSRIVTTLRPGPVGSVEPRDILATRLIAAGGIFEPVTAPNGQVVWINLEAATEVRAAHPDTEPQSAKSVIKFAAARLARQAVRESIPDLKKKWEARKLPTAKVFP